MAENVPPSQPNAGASAIDQPGRPYYEHLRTVLRSTIEKKRKLDEQLAALEEQIHKTEGTYLEETSGAGNIVRGFDGWVKGVVIGGRADDRRRGRVRDEDRIFSRSSVSWMRVSWVVAGSAFGLNVGLTRVVHSCKKEPARIRTLHLTRLHPQGLSRRSFLALTRGVLR